MSKSKFEIDELENKGANWQGPGGYGTLQEQSKPNSQADKKARMLESEVEEDVLYDASQGEDTQLLKQSNQEPRKHDVKKNNLCEKSKYPSSVFFILGTEFCERFNYYGLRGILVLYLTGWLRMNKDDATGLFHAFSSLAYFSPIFGAIIADGWLGRYRTILYISMVYSLGCIILSLTALPPPELAGPVIGLIIIALGTGGIKPCVVAFGADQFSAEQTKECERFFSAFYFMINMGSLLSMFITPVLRADVHCYQKTCYPLAFGVPAMLMLSSVAIFYAGKERYKHVPPTGSLFSKVMKCIYHGARMRCKFGKFQEEKMHWLDYAGDRFELSFINDIKLLLRVLWLFLPLPIFWALFNQQGSRWTIQATQLDGTMGKWQLKPDQLQALNPLLVILLIPIFDRIIYPLLEYCRIPNRPLQKMVAGMTFGAVAYCLAAFVQIQIDKPLDKPLNGQSGYTFINTADCPVRISSTSPEFYSGTITPYGVSKYIQTAPGSKHVTLECVDNTSVLHSTVDLKPSQASRLIIAEYRHNLDLIQFADKRTKADQGLASASFFINIMQNHSELSIRLSPLENEQESSVISNVTYHKATEFINMQPGSYQMSIAINDGQNNIPWQNVGDSFTLGSGSIYTVLVTQQAQKVALLLYPSIQASSLSMALMVPQYVIITIGEILFSITGLSFAYTQAPESMRSVVQAAWLLTTSIGDLIVMIVAQVRLVSSQSDEFFLFAGLMAVDIVIFSTMSYFYQYVEVKPAIPALPKTAVDENLPLTIQSSRKDQLD